MIYKIATLEEYILVWEKDIAKRPHKKAYIKLSLSPKEFDIGFAF